MDNTAKDLASGKERHPDAKEIEKEKSGKQREMREANNRCDCRGKDGEAQVLANERSVMRKERVIERVFDARDIEAAVLCQRMVAVNHNRAASENGKQSCPGFSGPVRLQAAGFGNRITKG